MATTLSEHPPQFRILLEQALQKNGQTFLTSQWDLAKTSQSNDFDAAVEYLQSCKIPYRIFTNITPSEFHHLTDDALCEVQPDGFCSFAQTLKSQTSLNVSLSRILIIEEKTNASCNLNANTRKPPVGLLEFWSRLQRSEWLIHALRVGFPSLKPVIAGSILINLLALATPFFSIQVYDRIIPNEAYSSLGALLLGVLFCLFFDHLLKHARHKLTEYAATASDSRCTELISKKLMNTPATQADPAYLLQHLRSFDSIREIITGMFLLSLIDLPFLLIFLIVIAVINPWFLLISLAVIGLTSMTVIYTHQKISRLGADQVNELRNNQSQWLDAIQNLESLQIHGVQQAYASILNKRQLISRLSGNNIREIVFASNQVIYLLQQVSWVSTICLGVFLIINQELTVGGLIAVSMLTMRCFAPISRLQSQLIQTHAAQAGFEDLDKFLSSVEKQEGKEPLTSIQTLILEQASAIKPGRDVNSQLQGDYLLREVNLEISQGDRIGIVGPTGSGKTSLLKLLSGNTALTAGQLRVNHLSINHYRSSEIGRCIGFAQQPPMLLKGTLLENLTLKRPWISTADCWEALSKVGLEKWVNHHPDGLNMTIENAGVNLSSGQKQLISVARTLAGKPTLLLLDEPTVCLDQMAEDHLIQTLRQLPPTVTLLFTTHKINLLACASKMALIHDGSLKSFGEKAQVMRAAQTMQEQLNG